MRPGSLRGGILSLVASACGSGPQVLPYTCIESGVVLVILWVLIVGIANYYGSKTVVDRAREQNIRSFAVLAEKSGGYLLRICLILSILLYLFASTLGC